MSHTWHLDIGIVVRPRFAIAVPFDDLAAGATEIVAELVGSPEEQVKHRAILALAHA